MKRSERIPGRRVALLACGAVLGLGACTLPSTHSVPTAQPEPRARPLPELPRSVPVRLSELERAARVRVDGCAEGPLELRRLGAEVWRSDGVVRGSFELHAAPGFAGLSIGERTYAGTLVFEPHGAGGLRVTNRVPLEDYVAGVAAAELVLWSALPAEIEAQAIAARSYALGTLQERGHPRGTAFVWDDTRDQVYRGRFVAPPTPRGREVEERLRRAVERGAGLVLVGEGELVDARFHASCGGWTARAEEVFGRARGGPGGAVACEPCARIGERERAAQGAGERPPRVWWEWTAGEGDLARLASSLGLGRSVHTLRPTSVDPHGRWLAVELSGSAARLGVDADELRRRLGATKLSSTRILSTWPRSGEVIARGLRFEGFGRGHGVGLCQVGAHEYAAAGWSARRILQHYYPGARLVSPSPEV